MNRFHRSAAVRAAMIALLASTLLLGAAPRAAAGEDQQSYSIDSPVGDLLDDPGAKAVLERLWGAEMVNNPSITMVRGMTFRAVAGIPAAQLDDAKLQAIQLELTKLKPSQSQ